jgi:hypothetical protein
MQHLQGSGTPVLYIGRTVLRGEGIRWGVTYGIGFEVVGTKDFFHFGRCAPSWFCLQDYTRMHGKQNLKLWGGR